MRVVSLVPSSTETLRAWGVDPVACTQWCEQPDLPTVGGTKNPDLDAIVALAPDLVVMDTTENRRRDAEALRSRGVAVLATEVHAVADVGPEMDRLAVAVGVVPRTRWPAGSPAPVRLRAFTPIWRRPWMTLSAATYGASLLAAIGVAGVFDDEEDPFPTVTLEEAASRAPDVVLAPTEPYTFSQAHLADLAAVAPVRVVDGRDLFWWGARTPGALERLASQLVA